MLNAIFKKTPLIDENTRQWMFDTVLWAIKYFDADTFHHETQLVLPTNEFYSGRVASVDEMANNIFKHTITYAGMQHWPLSLVNPNQPISTQLPNLEIKNSLRGNSASVILYDGEEVIKFTYNPQQINQPQDLIASYAQQLATLLVMQQKVLPPGGQECIAQAVDVLACFMGFGVIFANTAYQFRGGCGSCFNPRANREVALPENEILYCLAIFCCLKKIDNKDVVKHLKSHLRGEYKKMIKEVTKLLSNSQSFQLLTSKPLP